MLVGGLGHAGVVRLRLHGLPEGHHWVGDANLSSTHEVLLQTYRYQMLTSEEHIAFYHCVRHYLSQKVSNDQPSHCTRAEMGAKMFKTLSATYKHRILMP